jgi:hypothetical protein
VRRGGVVGRESGRRKGKEKGSVKGEVVQESRFVWDRGLFRPTRGFPLRC